VPGGLIEQLAAQELRTAAGGPAAAAPVHHWRRGGGRNAEIEGAPRPLPAPQPAPLPHVAAPAVDRPASL